MAEVFGPSLGDSYGLTRRDHSHGSACGAVFRPPRCPGMGGFRGKSRCRLRERRSTQPAVREEHLLRVDRGPDGRGEKLEFREKIIEAIADACVNAADKLISALEREPAD